MLALPTVHLSNTGNATFLAEFCYPALWVHTIGGPALIVVGYAQRAAVMMCLALLAGFVGVLLFGGAAKQRYGHTG